MRISDWSSDVCSSDLAVDTQQKHLPEVLKRAREHRGTSLVEIFQNCIVYNDGIFEGFTGRSVAADRQVVLEHGKPMLFGRDGTRGLRLAPRTDRKSTRLNSSH